MPEVAGQQFDYTPEGIAAAEAAATAEGVEAGASTDAMLDELVSVLPEEGDDLSVEEAVQEPEPEPEQPEDVPMPSDEMIVDLFESIYGEEMDESEQAQEQFQDLKELLAEMPELAAAIAAGEISPSEAAIMIFREAANTA
jgi:hypothetical protein